MAEYAGYYASERWRPPTGEFGTAPIPPFGVDPYIWQGIWEEQERARRRQQAVPQTGEFFRQDIVPQREVTITYEKEYGGAPPAKVTPQAAQVVRTPTEPTVTIQDVYRTQQQTSSFYEVPKLPTREVPSREIRTVQDFSGKPMIVKQDNILFTNLAAGFGGEEKLSREVSQATPTGAIAVRLAQYGTTAPISLREASLSGIEIASLVLPLKGFSPKIASIGIGKYTQAGELVAVKGTVMTGVKGRLTGMKTFITSDIKGVSKVATTEGEITPGIAEITIRKIDNQPVELPRIYQGSIAASKSEGDITKSIVVGIQPKKTVFAGAVLTKEYNTGNLFNVGRFVTKEKGKASKSDVMLFLTPETQPSASSGGLIFMGGGKTQAKEMFQASTQAIARTAKTERLPPVSLRLPKMETRVETKQELIRPSLRFKQETRIKSSTKQRQSSIISQTRIPKSDVSYRYSFRTGTRQSTRTDIAQELKMETRQEHKLRQATRTPTQTKQASMLRGGFSFPPVNTRISIPKIPKIGFETGIRRGKPFKQPKAYTPSLGGILSGITIGKAPKRLTGLETRYPVKRRRGNYGI